MEIDMKSKTIEMPKAKIKEVRKAFSRPIKIENK